MFQDILTALPLGFIMAFMFGPVFFVLLETAVIKGSKAAVIFDVGVILADVVFLLIAYFSTSRLLESIKDDPAIFIFGGFILATYGVISFIKQKKSFPEFEKEELQKLKKGDRLNLFVKGFLLNFVNIGVLGFWLGLIIAFGPTMEMDPERLFIFFSTILATYFLIDLLKILLAKKLEHTLTPERIFNLKKTISIIIFICGIALILRGSFPTRMTVFQNSVDRVIPIKDS